MNQRHQGAVRTKRHPSRLLVSVLMLCLYRAALGQNAGTNGATGDERPPFGKADPKDARALLARARERITKNDYQRARADLDGAIRLDPTNPDGWRQRAYCGEREGKLESALKDITEALRLDPHSAWAHGSRARLLSQMKDFAAAIPAFDEAIRLYPTDLDARIGRGLALRSLGRINEAMANYDEAIKVLPANAMLHSIRGGLLVKRKEYDKALADFDTVIGLQPNMASAYAGRAGIWGKMRDRDKEIADYTEAIRLAPHVALPWVMRGNCYSAVGLHKKAIADYDQGLRLDPRNPEFYVYRGNEWEKDAIAARVEPEKAMADYNRAIEVDPKYALAYRGRGRLWKYKGELAKAVSNFEELVRQDPQGAAGHRYLARILATCTDANVRNGRRAVAEATRACELSGWTDCFCLDTLAAAYAETGDFDSALKWLNEAIEFDSDAEPPDYFVELGDFGFSDRRDLYQSKKPCRERD
jgi:tetratricopeptide (TPR) repeat protein